LRRLDSRRSSWSHSSRWKRCPRHCCKRMGQRITPPNKADTPRISWNSVMPSCSDDARRKKAMSSAKHVEEA
jgi:hypothetical protein